MGSKRSETWQKTSAFLGLLIFIAFAVPVVAFADEPAEEAPPAAEVPAPTPAEVAGAQQEERELGEWLASPEATRQREASRSAYSELTAAESQNLLVESFPDQLQELNADPGRVISDLEVEKPLGEYGALVANEQGERSVLETSVPVESELGGNGKEPVDLALESSGKAVAPANPLSETVLPGSAEDAIRLEGGVSVQLPTSDDHPGQSLGAENLFYPETEATTDTLVSPLAYGTEVSEQLRSPESPEQFSFALNLPSGASLSESEKGGAEVVSAAGEVVTEVFPPTAVDAQGATVPVTMSIEDNSVVLEVPHRSSEYAYPILVDPVFVNYNAYIDENTNFSSGAWVPGQTTSSYEVRNFGSSLNAYSKGSGAYFPPSSYGAFGYNAPGETAWIAAATFSNISFFPLGSCRRDEPHGYVGLWNPSRGAYDSLGVYSGAEIFQPSFQTGWIGNTGTRTAIFGIGTDLEGLSMNCVHEIWMGGYSIQERDWEAPTFSSLPSVPGGWFDATNAPQATIAAWDRGFGVHELSIAESGGVTNHDPLGCSGVAESRCPASAQWNIPIPYKPGERMLIVTAEDPMGNVNEWTATTRVDEDKPEIELHGQLARATEEVGSESEAEENPASKNQLSLPVYNLQVKAIDGGQAANERQSGVTSMEVKLDKEETPLATWQEGCSQGYSCSREMSVQLKLNGLAGGPHHLHVLASDGAGHTREREIDFEYIPATGESDEYVMQRFPLSEGSEEQEHGPELAVNLMNGNLVYHEQDLSLNTPSTEVEVERYYNSQLPEEDSSEWGAGWTLAQTPRLEEISGGDGATGRALTTEAVITGEVALPDESTQQKFSPKLHATVVKRAGGGYEVTDENGRTTVYDADGRVAEVKTGPYSSLDYGYEAGELSGIAVEDPAATTEPPPETPPPAPTYPTFLSAFGSAGSGEGQLNGPRGVAADGKGHVWVVDRANSRIEEFDESGQYLGQFGSAGSGDGQFDHPWGIAVTPQGNLWVADSGNYRLQEFDSEGQFIQKFGTKAQLGSQGTELIEPESIGVTADGMLWVTDCSGDRVVEFREEVTGETERFVRNASGTSIEFPQGIAVDESGDVWVSEEGQDRLLEFDPEGSFIRAVGSTGSGEGQFQTPQGVGIGPSGEVYAVDQGGDRVEVFDEEGEYLTQFGTEGTGNGNFTEPKAVAFGTNGAIFVTDKGNNRVHRWGQPFLRNPAEEEGTPPEDDPKLALSYSSGLVSAVEGEQIPAQSYEHDGDLLTAHENQNGEKAEYEYDEAERLTAITLPDGTSAGIEYEALGRVKAVTMQLAGKSAKTTRFEYQDEPRETTVRPEGEPVVHYQIGEDGSIFKWSNAQQPPEIEPLGGSLYFQRGEAHPDPISPGDQNLEVGAYSPEGIASIQVIANGNQLIEEETCDVEEAGSECDKIQALEFVTDTENWQPGILWLEVLVTDALGQKASERFWDNIPTTPPPEGEAPQPPTFEDIKHFREEFGLDLDLTGNKLARNERIFELINAWHRPGTYLGEVARASWERWGVPMRPQDVADMEWREAYLAQDLPLIEEWASELHGGTYGGYAVDNRAGGLIIVGFTSEQDSSINDMKSQLPLMAPGQISGEVIPPNNSLQDLESVEAAIEDALDTNEVLGNDIVEIGLDEQADAVVVGSTNVEAAESAMPAVVGANAPVLIYPEEEGVPYSGRYQDSGRIQAGTEVTGLEPLNNGETALHGCTANFGAWESRGVKPNGELKIAQFLLVAGHCAEKMGLDWARSTEVQPKHLSSFHKFGVAKRTGAPLEGQHYETDAAAIRLDSSGLIPTTIYKAPGNNRPVDPAGVARHGETLCFSGVRTNAVRCGEMVGVRYRRGLRGNGRHLFIITRFAGLPGDSGAPVWNPRTGRSIGLVTGGPNNGKYKDWVTPLLRPRGFSAEKVPGALHAPGMGNLHLREGP
jgi:YD repeat-containing protein